ncbi:pectate lyase-like [Prosopis cineraria]|uniref:pectate lyase-like n=1 Tax=Prosopis cineraria TaxID=364024 RepID=UPI0024108F49|nr:pectate lyase-like [Prosopis cineraria]
MGKIMTESAARVTLLLMATLAITVPCLVDANIGDFDDYLREKAKQARRVALEAYEPNPLKVTSELNMHVHLAMNEAKNSSRGRDLSEKRHKGPCLTTNPIDRCWRCDKDWEKNRFKLAECAMGFGRKTTGGLGGKIYVVTDSSDVDVANPKPGTLRYAAIQKEPLWIIFAHSMVIKLKQELLVNSDKTIDGRGANIHIKSGGGLTLQFVKNVIIHNLRIRNIKAKKGGLVRDAPDHVGLRTRSDGDAISIFGSTNVWIDHISMSNADDGLVDAIMGSTAITISNCHMTRHNDVMLFGAGDVYQQDRVMQVTVAFNHFGNGLIQRMPRCRHGWFHVVNNDYHNWIMYAIGGTANPTILSQGNRFSAPNNEAAKQVTNRVSAPESAWKNWRWQTEHDEFVNGAFFVPSGTPITESKFDKEGLIPPRPGIEAPELARFSGQIKCKVGNPC